MELVCDAICAGAFKSPEWIKFKTRLATDPSFQNVVKFLEMDAPQPYTPIVGNPKDDGTWVLTCNIDRFADDMEANNVPPNRPADLPPGNWLMPLLSFGKRIGGFNKKKTHALLDKYGLRNYPAGNRQSWTVCLDSPMPPSLRQQLETPSAKK
jgi:hypothetical protein